MATHPKLRSAAMTQARSGQRERPTPAADPSETTLVIGAGIAGLTAAQALRAAGRAVEVLEARDRLGGRAWSVDLAGATVELGAGWLQGDRGSPIADYCRAHGIAYAADPTVESVPAIFDVRVGRLGRPARLW